jgi:hypothetical protein
LAAVLFGALAAGFLAGVGSGKGENFGALLMDVAKKSEATTQKNIESAAHFSEDLREVSLVDSVIFFLF